MLRLTISQLISGLSALSAIEQMPINGNAKLAYNIGRINKQLKQQGEIARKHEASLFENFGAVQTAGRYIFDADQLTPDQQANFNKQINDLYAVEVEIWGNQITVAEIDAAGLSLSPIQFEQLDWLIADPAGESTQETAKSASA